MRNKSFTVIILTMLVFGSLMGAAASNGAPIVVPWMWGMVGGALSAYLWLRKKWSESE